MLSTSILNNVHVHALGQASQVLKNLNIYFDPIHASVWTFEDYDKLDKNHMHLVVIKAIIIVAKVLFLSLKTKFK